MTVVTTITAICVVFVAFVMRILKFLEHTVIKGACRALEIVADRMHSWTFVYILFVFNCDYGRCIL